MIYCENIVDISLRMYSTNCKLV